MNKTKEVRKKERMDVREEWTAAQPRAEPAISHRRAARRQVTAAAAEKSRTDSDSIIKSRDYFWAPLSVLIHCVSDRLEKCGAQKQTARWVVEIRQPIFVARLVLLQPRGGHGT